MLDYIVDWHWFKLILIVIFAVTALFITLILPKAVHDAYCHIVTPLMEKREL